MSKPPPQPPPEPRPLSVLFSAERVKLALTSPALVLTLLALALLPGMKEWLLPARQPPPPGPSPAIPAWAPADAGMLLARVVPGRLPPPGEGWKTGGCDSDLGEQERNGSCWMETKVPPPCPAGKLWEDEGKCWRPIPKTARRPTSDDLRPQQSSVAAP